MKRELTVGEKAIIREALNALAEDADFSVIELLRRPIKEELAENSSDDKTEEDRLAVAKVYAKRAERLRNLGYFIDRNDVVVECKAMIGHQF